MTDFSLPSVSLVRSQLESVLLVVDAPVSVSALAVGLAVSEDVVVGELLELRRELDVRGSGFELRETEEGWRLYTRRENAEVVEHFLLSGAQSKLSRAAMETLAIIAHRQPATRAQVSAVNVDGVIRTLVLRGLIREVAGGHARRYETTELFLELLGIDSLDRLPDLAPLLPDIDSIDEFDL